MQTDAQHQSEEEIYAKLHEAEQQAVVSAKCYSAEEILKELHLTALLKLAGLPFLW